MNEKVYLVGGWVRDYYLRKELNLDIPQGDRDWVVVGGNADALLKRGFRSVGKDFPVFLHPQTHEEYALARTERKIGPGYHGFEFDTTEHVTLEEDLLRRDLTINAMAWDGKQLLDPYHGLDDLRNHTLRHVSSAFVEDPVRILRVARFCARFPQFHIADETLKLMQRMVENGEVDTLVGERIFKEFEKGLMQKQPSRMILALIQCHLWERLFPFVPISEELLEKLDFSDSHQLNFAQRFALLCSGITDSSALLRIKNQLKLPSECYDLLNLIALCRSLSLRTHSTCTQLLILEKCDAFRRPERFRRLVQVLDILGWAVASNWLQYARCATQVNSAQIAASTADKRKIGEAIHLARLAALKELSNELV